MKLESLEDWLKEKEQLDLVDSAISKLRIQLSDRRENLKKHCKCPPEHRIYKDVHSEGTYYDKSSTERYINCGICEKYYGSKTLYVGGYG